MRTKPPGMTAKLSPCRARKTRRMNGRGSSLPLRHTGMVESRTASCSTMSMPRSSIASRMRRRRTNPSSLPRTPSPMFSRGSSPAEAGSGADEEAVIARREVLALHQQETEIAGEIGVLEISFVHRSRRQHADAGIALVAKSGEFRLHRLKERRVTQNMQIAVDVRNALAKRKPVFQRKAGARRRLSAVAQDPPSAVGAARDVDGINA